MREVVQFLGGGAIVIAALSWLARSLVIHLLSKDIEGHKSKLNYLNESALAEISHSLQIAKMEHGVRFSRLHEERFKRIEEIGRRLFDLHDSVFEALRVDSETKDERRRIAESCIDDFSRYLKSAELYFPEGFTDRLIEALYRVRMDLMEFDSASSDRTNDWGADRRRLKKSVDRIVQSVNDIWKEGISDARILLTEGEQGGRVNESSAAASPS